MVLNIRNHEAEKLAADLAALTGETKTETVIKALKNRFEAVRREQLKRHILDRLDEIAIHCASCPSWIAGARKRCCMTSVGCPADGY